MDFCEKTGRILDDGYIKIMVTKMQMKPIRKKPEDLDLRRRMQSVKKRLWKVSEDLWDEIIDLIDEWERDTIPKTPG
jgi:hypothetical protein